jgi:hypothetical protein
MSHVTLHQAAVLHVVCGGGGRVGMRADVINK